MEEPKRIYINRTRPYVTYVLIGINIAVFLLEQVLKLTGMSNAYMLLKLGAKENTLITCGQYWRLLSACFLHANLAHIVSNLIGLYFWGPHIETLLGRIKYLIVYLTAGIFGSLLSYVCSTSFSVGASGALFGIFGTLLYFRTRHKQVFNHVFGMQVLVIIGINLINGFLGNGIDNFGHIGGLIGGFLAAYCTGLYREKLRWHQVLSIIGLVLLAAGLFTFGIWKYSAQLGIPPFSFLDVAY